MKGYGHLWQAGLPFMLVGLFWCIKHFKEPTARIVLIMLLSAPVGAAIVHLGITRALVMVIPATLLTTFGIVIVWDWLKLKLGKFKFNLNAYSALLKFGVLCIMIGLNILMLVNALRNGATWFDNYGLYGMQFGAQQVFATIEEELNHDPEQKFYLTSAWANGADVLARYFFEDPLPFQMGSIDGFINEYKTIDPETVFVMTQEEMQKMQDSGKFTNIQTETVINYPDGEPGFYFTRLNYVENIEEIFSAELIERRKLNNGHVFLADGEEIEVEYSTLDMGEILHMFDGDQATLARTWEANPLRLIIRFSEPRTISHLSLRVGGEPTRVEAELWTEGNETSIVLKQELTEASNPRFIELNLSEPTLVDWAEVRVFNLNNAEPAHVHLWELQFIPLISP